jgi:hypothetical protein
MRSSVTNLVNPIFARLGNAANAVLKAECDYHGEFDMDHQSVWFDVGNFKDYDEVPRGLEIIKEIFGPLYNVDQIMTDDENFIVVTKQQHHI